MGRSDFYKPGDYNVVCDRCGMKRKASELRLTWDNLFVCSSTCWEQRHPQDFVKSILEEASVPDARPAVPQTIGQTTLNATAARNAIEVSLTSGSGVSDRDTIGIELDNGAVHWTFSNGAPSGHTVILGSYLPSQATSGNIVHIPGINSETYITSADITGSDH